MCVSSIMYFVRLIVVLNPAGSGSGGGVVGGIKIVPNYETLSLAVRITW